MAQEISVNLEYENNEVPKPIHEESAGCLGIGFSFLFPIVGVILFFVKRRKDFDASGYLIAAGISFMISFILRIAMNS